jgi:hypothetical protein
VQGVARETLSSECCFVTLKPVIKILNPFLFARFFNNPTTLNPLMQNVSLQSFIEEVEISVSNIVMVALFGVWFVIRAM